MAWSEMNNPETTNYDREIPSQRWGLVGFMALVLTLVGLAAWEWQMRRIGLLVGDLNNAPAAWAVERRKLTHPDPDAIAVVGASRILFDFNLDIFEEKIGIRPVQLALGGTNARPYLQDMGDNEAFNGLLIVGITPGSFFRQPRKRDFGRLEHYRNQSPTQRSGHLIVNFLEMHLAFIDSGYALFNIIEQNDWPERRDIDGPYLDVWKIASHGADRYTYMWPRLEYDAYLVDHAQRVWSNGMSKPRSQPEDIVNQVIDAAVKNVQDIRARGGEVTFVRLPSSGEYIELETDKFPRTEVWDRLLRETGSFGVHFADYPQLRDFDPPEWSHLYREDADIFSREYAKILLDELEWFQDRRQGEQ
jgi:hypothetical protein